MIFIPTIRTWYTTELSKTEEKDQLDTVAQQFSGPEFSGEESEKSVKSVESVKSFKNEEIVEVKKDIV